MLGCELLLSALVGSFCFVFSGSDARAIKAVALTTYSPHFRPAATGIARDPTQLHKAE